MTSQAFILVVGVLGVLALAGALLLARRERRQRRAAGEKRAPSANVSQVEFGPSYRVREESTAVAAPPELLERGAGS